MAAKKEDEQASAVPVEGSHFHIVVRAIVKTVLTSATDGAVTAEQFDGIINQYLAQGWKVLSCSLVGQDESVFTFAVALVR